MVKSHPRFQASAYKLSDLTSKGQTAAIINVDPNADFVFQVIARENKGAALGIEYAYSAMVTSYATDSRSGAHATGHAALAPAPATTTTTTPKR